MARLEDLFGTGRQREATTFMESEDQNTGLERWGRRRGTSFGSSCAVSADMSYGRQQMRHCTDTLRVVDGS